MRTRRRRSSRALDDFGESHVLSLTTRLIAGIVATLMLLGGLGLIALGPAAGISGLWLTLVGAGPPSRAGSRRPATMTAVAGTTGPIVPPARRSRTARRDARKGHEPKLATPASINRELSWLEYSARVLYEAADPRNPLLERV